MNNSGDTLILKDPSGDEIAKRIYGGSSEGKSNFYVPSAQPPTGGYYTDQQDNSQWARTDNISANTFGDGDYGSPGSKNEQTGEGSTPTAITLSDLSTRATSPALLVASVLLLGAVIAWRRKRA